MPVPLDPARVVAVFHKQQGKPLKAKDVSKALGLDADDRGVVRDALLELSRKGTLIALEGKRYVLPGKVDAYPGTVQRKASGVGWFIPDDRKKLPDGFLPPGELVSLLDGDRVLAELVRGQKGPVARVVRVLERRKTPLVGILTLRGKTAFVEVDGGAISGPILVPVPPNAKGGEVVEVTLTVYPTDTAVSQGTVARILGKRGALDAEVEKILVEKGVWRPFPGRALDEAGGFPVNPSAEDSEGREDIRALRLVTIDGETAKDFDDAVHCEQRKGSKDITVTVAIADVSHYVKEGSALDDEARKRGTSVYWPGSVVPMLPEALSNGLCSLKPHVDRLCTVAQFDVGPDGAVSNEHFYTGVMKSHARLTYTIVQKLLDGDAEAQKEIPHTLQPSLKLCEEASKRLRKAREARGALDFDLPELKIDLDENGAPIAVRPMERLYAHKLIEDLMVAANEAVARRFEERSWPCVYRIHDPPDEEKLERFKKLARTLLGRKLDELKGGDNPRALMQLMHALKDSTKKRALDTLLLRSMMQAKYSTQNNGHYGLGSDAYLHFTSPIRRYPDLVVHRLLKDRLSKKKGAPHKPKKHKHADHEDSLLSELDDIATSSSDRERAATDVERAVDGLMGAYLMKDKVGETFSGVVQGVAEFGLFVLLEPDTIEGLVHVAEMPGDFWQFDDVHLALVGERTRQSYTIGDRLEVQLTAVDLARRQITLRLVQEESEQPRRGRGRGRGHDADDRSERPERPLGRDATEEALAADRRARFEALRRTHGKGPSSGGGRGAPAERAQGGRGFGSTQKSSKGGRGGGPSGSKGKSGPRRSR
jgi:ribonuclease R